MSNLNSTHSLSTAFVRRPLFFINGFYNIPHAKYFYIFLGFVFVITVLGNSFVMFVICVERSLHTPKYMAVFHLVTVDLVESTALIPNLIVMFLLDSQYISFDACLANLFFVFFFSCLQTLTITILAYDRMVAICLPLRYHAIITMPAMAVILTVAWAYSSLFLILTISLFTRFSFCRSIVVFVCDHGTWINLTCNENFINYIMALVNTVCYCYLPLILTALSYMFIAGALSKIASWEGRYKAMKTCSAHLLLVAICYLPMVGSYGAVATRSFPSSARITNTLLTFAIPPMMNPIIYVLSTDEVKDFSIRLLKNKKINDTQ